MEKQVIIPLKDFRQLERLPKVIDGVAYALENICCDFEDNVYGDCKEEQKQSKRTIENVLRDLTFVFKVISETIK